MKTIEVESMVALRDGKPYVVLIWGDKHGQLTPDEARQFAYYVLEMADVAESDAFIFKFFIDRVQGTPDDAAIVLLEFRKYREKLRGEEVQ